jgi:hypothetical protein
VDYIHAHHPCRWPPSRGVMDIVTACLLYIFNRSRRSEMPAGVVMSVWVYVCVGWGVGVEVGVCVVLHRFVQLFAQPALSRQSHTALRISGAFEGFSNAVLKQHDSASIESSDFAVCDTGCVRRRWSKQCAGTIATQQSFHASSHCSRHEVQIRVISGKLIFFFVAFSTLRTPWFGT